MTLRLVSKPVNGGGDFGPPPTVPKESVGGKERERERERLDASPGPAFPAPGQVNPLSSNIETNYRSPALVIIQLQINAFKLSAFEITVLLGRPKICGRLCFFPISFLPFSFSNLRDGSTCFSRQI